MHKLARPDEGDIAFVTQSGAAGSCIVDLVATYNTGMSKFISYGNGTVLDESDILEFLENDKKTKQILLYIEGVKDGRKFLDVLKRVNKKKPIIVLKAGKSEKASKAAFSHTGNMAGSYLAYLGAFRQSKIIWAERLEELFEFVRIFGQPMPKGKRGGSSRVDLQACKLGTGRRFTTS
jgi:acetyl-CoA synthetase (ADP-forming) alpha subunit (EC 6.2.1.13)/branched-chain acyl-CoA synthetase (ADP-forming) alpha subunit (EC 6.2.1.-)/aryl-CoA synthetase (ADP-forming) alpha subunit (EC 6.2.1.-)